MENTLSIIQPTSNQSLVVTRKYTNDAHCFVLAANTDNTFPSASPQMSHVSGLYQESSTRLCVEIMTGRYTYTLRRGVGTFAEHGRLRFC